jgi:tRNA A37 threonylcarbamoyladenosine modification protein TsaB
MYLFINNLSGQKIYLAIFNSPRNIKWRKIGFKKNHRENILFELDKFLKTNKIKLKSLNGIIVVNGPGSFAGIRTILTLTNVLSAVLNIPAFGVSANKETDSKKLLKKRIKTILRIKTIKPVQPFYGQNPNICCKKTKINP